MKSVTFVKSWDMYFVGDSASFPTEFADKIIAAGVAVAYVAPEADDKKAAKKF